MEENAQLLIQVALILGAARLLGAAMRRLNQPAVLGELLAGILLGPSLLGWCWPEAHQLIFARPGPAGNHSGLAPLDYLANLGLVFLMLFAGLETDARMMQRMGRVAFSSALTGMAGCFACGFLLGFLMDDRHVSPAQGRLPLALFMATALAVSAMPVIAKILMDLNLMKRDLGVIILSAAVLNDTLGWIILAFISGLVAEKSFDLPRLGQTLVWLALFLLGVRYLIHPLIRRLLSWIEHRRRGSEGELVLMLVLALLFAAGTRLLHVHEAFGAFIAGMVLRQCPSLERENLRRLEGLTNALFAPLFFGAVGLQVDLRALAGFLLPATVLLLAFGGTLAWFFIGGRLGGLDRRQALALGAGMIARGAVGLVVAKIGLDLQIVDAEVFAVLVLMAIITSVAAPLALRPIAAGLPLTEEEKLRESSPAGRLVPVGPLKVLIPAGGGPNALTGCHFAARLCRNEGDRCLALHVDLDPRPRWRRLFSRRLTPVFDMRSYEEALRAAAGPAAGCLTMRRQRVAGSLSETLLAEARKGYHFLVVGASGRGHPIRDPVVAELARGTPCHLMVVAARARSSEPAAAFRRILVPTNGTYAAEAAFEVAARYAEATGAGLSACYVIERNRFNPLLPAAVEHADQEARNLIRLTLRQQLSERFRHPERLECRVRESDSLLTGLLEEVGAGEYDLVMLGAENRSLVDRFYPSRQIEEVLAAIPCSVALMVPKFGFHAPHTG